MVQGKFLVLKKDEIGINVFKLLVHSPQIAKESLSGQFVNINIDGFLLRRPISISDIDIENETITIIFEIRGEGTEKLSHIKSDDYIDIIGPLGRGFKLINKESRAVVIGGGIGSPPLVSVSKFYGKNSFAILGFQNKSKVILEDVFKTYCKETIICTDDGSMGLKGFVTNGLNELLLKEKIDIIYTCGPLGMMKGIADIAKKNNIQCQVSMEQKMACGMGNCLVCACEAKRNNKKTYLHICKDGPVFDYKEVFFDE